MPDSSGALSYAVRPRVVGYYLSQLALMLVLLTLVPFGVSVAFGESAYGVRFGIVIAGLALVAWRGMQQPAPQQIQTNEALVVVGLAFVITPLLMTVPLSASGLPYIDVLFESVSAITTTGLSTAGSVDDRAPIFHFTRAWMQWFGGLGIAALSVALLMGHHAAARRLSDPVDNENIATTARTQARQLLTVYGTMTVVGVIALWAVTGDAFVAVVHMLATVSTGGFSSFDASLAAMPPAAGWIVSVFALLGAVPLLLYYGALRRPRELFADREVHALAVMVVLLCGLLTLSLATFSSLPWADAVEQAVLSGVSAQTTTGFASMPVAQMDPLSHLLLIVGMLIGGGSGSTAGGIKLLRLLIFWRLLQHFLHRSAMPPHAVADAHLGGRRLEAADIERTMLVLGLFTATILVSWLIFVGQGFTALDALFEVVSAVSTVGLSSGISGPELAPTLKLLLCTDMLLGRLEILALLVLLYPRTWIGRRTP